MSRSPGNESGPSQIVFGTVVRNAPVVAGGELILLDWLQKKVVRSVPIYPDNPRMDDDPNPRGNTRGCKGISIAGEQIVAANFHTLQIFDTELNHLSNFSHGLMVGTHETHTEDGRHIWLASTVIDAAIEYDMLDRKPTRSFFPREMPQLQRELKLEPAGIDPEDDNRRLFLSDDHLKSHSHLHLNAVAERNGEIFALFHAHGVVCNLSSGKVAICDENLVKSHNLLFLSDSLVAINDTYRRFVRIYNIESGIEEKAINLMDFPWIRRLDQQAERKNLPRKILNRLHIRRESISRPLFVRGLAGDQDRLYVGLSPAAIVCIDWRSGDFIDAFQYSDDPRVCVHGLAVL